MNQILERLNELIQKANMTGKKEVGHVILKIDENKLFIYYKCYFWLYFFEILNMNYKLEEDGRSSELRKLKIQTFL